MTTSNQSTNPSNSIKSISNSSFVREFKEFINRGSVVDLAIGVAVGGAFTAIVKSLVDDIIMPLSSLLAGGFDFSTLSLNIPNVFGANTVAHIAYGNFIQNVVNFILIALTIFIIVRAMNKLNRRNDAEAKAKADAEAQAAEAKADAKADAKTKAAEAKADKRTDKVVQAVKDSKK